VDLVLGPGALVRQRTRAKNEVHAVLARSLLGRPPCSDLLGAAGRAWLAEQELAAEEAETLAGCLRQVDFLDAEIEAIDRRLAEWALASPEARRLMTIPGIDVGVAVALMAAIGDVSRFPSARQLVAYLGLDPRVRQSGDEAPRHGRISKRGNAQARSALVEAAWSALGPAGPLRAFGERIRARKGGQVAAVAVARKIAALAWHLLTSERDYAYGRPSLHRRKLRRLERRAGAPRLPTRHGGRRISATPAEREAERRLQEQAEAAYRRLVAAGEPPAPDAQRGARAPHRGAHPKQRGRDQPQTLRFSSGSPAPARVLQEEVQAADST